ncbi:MAG: UDP-N-acetylmuramate:L-alanyl-gamma-D-glutamyl-meso-diaminopimelate ligase [Verrucomicrobia bacterium]|nr:UDP-N-acetylmuramate:L-alanyl-gamma-D-glutamyl-meso-diaminopimelate ligase [Verrucomicrobiota bacterium]
MISGQIGSVHFVGIGGTAMGSAAIAMQKLGYRVTGSDQAIYEPMAGLLATHRVPVTLGYAEANLDPAPDLVVIGNAITRGNPEAEAALNRRLRYCSLPELLREFFIRGRRSLVVTGTHGKTTTTALLAHVFEASGRQPCFLIGGSPRNFPVGARFEGGEWFIIEGDEYDTAFFDKRSKFIHYLPEVVIANNLEFDHADIFPDLAAIQTSFRHLFRILPGNGLLLANGDDPNLAPLLSLPHTPTRRFGLGDGNDARATDVTCRGDQSEFTVGSTRFHLPLAGAFNVRNALGVLACARHCGLTDAEIQRGFSTFQGVKRRLDPRGEADGVVVLDDFAHHPTALAATLEVVRLKYPGRRVWAVFEPRSNTTRRNVFQQALVSAFAGADLVVVSQVARLTQLRPEERLDPEQLIRDLRARGKVAHYLPDVPTILDLLANETRPGDVVCVFSNGEFDRIHEKLLSVLRAREGRQTRR